jgi:3',5'-cyclic AMP phosphodiesterase CpdA
MLFVGLLLGIDATGQARGQVAPATGPGRVHRIALVSDPHVSTRPAEAHFVRHFREVIRQVNEADVEAVVLSGDLTQDGAAAHMKEFKRMVGEFRAKTFCVPGNHDVGNKRTPGQKMWLGAARLKNFRENVGPTWFVDELVPGVRVLGICSPLMGSGLPEEEEQWGFIERTLAEKGGATVILTHYPPYVGAVGEANEYFNIDQAPRQRLLAVLEAGGVKTVLSGHLHRPIDMTTPGGVHVIGAPAVSFGLPPRVQREGWVLVTLSDDGTCSAELKYLPLDPMTSSRPTTNAVPSSRPSVPERN